MYKQSLAAAAFAVALCGNSAAYAHDDPKARHGGIVQVVNDVAYELVGRDGNVEIYVTDHGKPVSTVGMTGRLTVLAGGQKSDAALVPAGDKLEAKGVNLTKGAKLVAALTLPNKKVVTVRFAVK